ncbi:MAG: hypothetical protein ABIQ98_02675 [Sphingomicrobium sp.]
MKKLYHAVAVALLVTPTLALSQELAEQIGAKQKAWLTSNFRTGLSDCAIVPLKDGFALSGTGVATFDDSDGGGLDFSIATAPGAAPVVTALAIKTKGTSAQRQRAIDSVCEATASAAGRASSGSSLTCSVSGSPDAPEIRFVVPLATLGDAGSAKSYVGTVTIVKRAADAAAIAQFLSKKGYDYYQARGAMSARATSSQPTEMTVVAACDTSGLSAKAGKPVAHYDLAVNKKV